MLLRSKRHLQFVLITTDLSSNSREEVLEAFAHYPILQAYSAAQLESFFRVRNAKVVGFKKSGLAQSIYRELKGFRINAPSIKATPPKPRVEPSDS
jgi:hypothetical protein